MKSRRERKTLYICYFGLRQPLVQTQVIPYLLELMKSDKLEIAESEYEDIPGYIDVSLLTFESDFHENWTKEQIEAEKANLAEKGIDWYCLPYHKRFSAVATAYDIFRGAWFIRRINLEKKFDVLHGRVHVPTLMGALARKFSQRKPKLLFDIRGFFPEEYTDAGVWPEGGLLYRWAKRIEKWLMKEADGFVVLTDKARDALFPEAKETGLDKFGRPVEMIPCCVDIEKRFSGNRDSLREETRSKLGVKDRFVFAHVGALGGLYLTEQIADFLQTARMRNSNIFALFLTQSDPSLIVPLLKLRGFEDSDYFVGRADPNDVPSYLSASDVGLSFVRSSYATQSRSPTKIPEYLACELPVIANSGVGDVDALIARNGVGVSIVDFGQASYLEALKGIEELCDIRERCRETAVREFDLSKVGGLRYRRLYSSLLADN
jgi:glycosyltransferase involved in cell wall biosynthesis